MTSKVGNTERGFFWSLIATVESAFGLTYGAKLVRMGQSEVISP